MVPINKLCRNVLNICEDKSFHEQSSQSEQSIGFRYVAERLYEKYIKLPFQSERDLSDFERKVLQVYPKPTNDFYKESLEISLSNDWHENHFPKNSLFDAQHFLYKKYLDISKEQN